MVVNVNKLMWGCYWLCVVGVFFLNVIVDALGGDDGEKMKA